MAHVQRKMPKSEAIQERDTIDDTLTASAGARQANVQDAPLDFTSKLAASAVFIELDEVGKLTQLNPLLLERQNVFDRLWLTKKMLQACNDENQLAIFAKYCKREKRGFAHELRKLVNRLETKKLKLERLLEDVQKKLHHKQLQLIQIPLRPSSTIREVPITLVPTLERRSASSIADRDAFISDHRHLRHWEICQRLDFEFARKGQIPRCLPRTWASRYNVKSFREAYQTATTRPLVQKLISTVKARHPYPERPAR